MGKNLKAWARGKSVGAALFGREVAVSADNLHWYLTALHRGRGLDRLGPIPPLRVWLGFYRNHRLLQEALVDGWYPVKSGKRPTSAKVQALQAGLRAFSRMEPDEIRAELAKVKPGQWESAARRLGKIGQRLLDEQDREIDDGIAGRPNVEDAAAVDRVIGSAAMQFFMRVWLPCLLIYKTYPTRLFRAARVGPGTKALEKLLKLDKAILGDCRIADRLHRLAAGFKRVDLSRVGRVLGRGPDKISRKEFKNSLAGLISRAVGGLDKKLTGPELGNLFDAVAKDLGRDIDPDVSPKSDGWAKAIQRWPDKWKNIIPGADSKTSG